MTKTGFKCLTYYYLTEITMNQIYIIAKSRGKLNNREDKIIIIIFKIH